jgi:hypothetical protein
MTVQEFQAGCIERAGRTLAYHLKMTQEDKRDWTPNVEGAAGLRSALGMASECIIVNRLIAAILRGETPAPVHPIETERPFADPSEAGKMLRESAKELADAVRGLSNADLEKEFTSRRGPMPGHMLIEIPYRNMQYHSGQINLLQLCYGDTEFRMPAPPTADEEE